MSDENQSSSGNGSQPQSGAGQQQGNSSQASSSGNTQSTNGQGTQSQQQAPARPAYVPETFFDATAGKVKEKEFSEHISALTAFKAADDSRKLSLPQKPDDYPIELPASFKPPEGVKYELNANDPLWAQARTWAQKNGLSKEAFIEGIGLIAGKEVASEQTIQTARAAEIAKLGATGTARVTALTTWLKSYLGETEGAQLSSRLFTASDVQIMEKLVHKVTTQGAGNFNAGGREPPEQQGRLSPEQISKLPMRERLDYTREQSRRQQMPEWRDPRVA